MKINRVFCYSKEVAKKNGNLLPILQLLLTFILGIIALIWITIVNNNVLLILLLVTWMFLLIYYVILLSIRMRGKLTGYATDMEGRIFKVIMTNNGQCLYLNGVAVGSMSDQIIGSHSNIGKNLGGLAGATAQIYSVNRSSKYMSNPEVVAKIVESVPNISGAEVYEILKVNSILDKKKLVKVNCDYKILKTGKVKYNKIITIEKSLNSFDDLVNLIRSHKQ